MLAVPLAPLLCALAVNDWPRNQLLQHLLEYHMEPSQEGPSAEEAMYLWRGWEVWTPAEADA